LSAALVCLGLILPNQVQGQPLNTDNGIDVCYGPTDEIIPCDETTGPVGNENCETDGTSDMRPRIDPDTCEPICYGPTDEIIPCDETKGPIGR
jgi:hypothetical protein